MSLEFVTLRHVSIKNVHGDTFSSADIGEAAAFKARFGLSIETEEVKKKAGEFRFEVVQNFEAVLPNSHDPFFKIEIVGHFTSINEEKISAWLDTQEGAYDLGATLFPYMRALAKPLLEGLGASQIEFPWSSPQIAKTSGSTTTKKPVTKRKTSKPKAPQL